MGCPARARQRLRSWPDLGWGDAGTGDNGPVPDEDYYADNFVETIVTPSGSGQLEEWVDIDITSIAQQWQAHENNPGVGIANLTLGASRTFRVETKPHVRPAKKWNVQASDKLLETLLKMAGELKPKNK